MVREEGAEADDHRNSKFQEKEYWDKRYTSEGEQGDFDWFKKYEDLRPYFEEIIGERFGNGAGCNALSGQHKKDLRILMLGCGNSTLSADMFRDGYKKITNLDYSKVVIELMRSRLGSAMAGMDWVEGDITKLEEWGDSYEKGEIQGQIRSDVEEDCGGITVTTRTGQGAWDIIIDKGTMDALMAETNGSVWSPSPAIVHNVSREVDGVLHLLKERTGIFLYLTFGQPHFRRPLLERAGWKVEVKTIGEVWHYFLYVCRKD